MFSYLINELELAYPVVTNFSFSHIKGEKEVQKYLESAKVYLIGQRPQLEFRVLDCLDQKFIKLELVQGSILVAKCYLPVYQEAFETKIGDDLDVEFGSHDPAQKYDETYPKEKVHGIKIWRNRTEFVAWFTPEKLLFEYSRGLIKLGEYTAGTEIIDYRILYAGKSTDQSIWARLTGHETLQDILSKERPLQYGEIPTHEIVLILLKFKEADHIKGFVDVPDLVQNDYVVSEKEIMLESEKLLVKLLDPIYNDIKFKKYPQSTDGLHKYAINTIEYSIRDDMVLFTDKGKLLCSRHDEPSIIRVSEGNIFVD